MSTNLFVVHFIGLVSGLKKTRIDNMPKTKGTLKNSQKKYLIYNAAQFHSLAFLNLITVWDSCLL